MGRVEDIVEQMRRNPKDVRFSDACHVCEHYFGRPRMNRTSHKVYKTPWEGGDPRVNIQNDKGKAKAYQIKQLLRAIDRLEYESRSK